MPRLASEAKAAPIALADVTEPDITELGGKAASLVRLAGAGFRVPEAAVLPASWFAAWWTQLEAGEAWSRFEATLEAPWAATCQALQAAAAQLPYTPAMRADLEALQELNASWGGTAGCAVRSSSPDEDLASASFAGGYVTLLGVLPDGLEDAVRACFVSCLDERVVVYKAQHGFDVHRPRIAVLVQRQVESEVSGVGFSLNPVTNDYDEAVIDANFGLGETVVSGEVSPDHFVVDKPGRNILERQRGSKQVARWIQPGGGVEVREQAGGEQTCLDDAQVLELSDVLTQLEQLYEHPVDIEWAYAGGELQLLQARPITAYFPLSEDMQTAPGARRRLYIDGNLSDGITSNRPISKLTLDGYREVMARLTEGYGFSLSGEEKPLEDLMILRGARMYTSLSDMFWFISPKLMAEQSRIMDILLYRTLQSVDRARYKPTQKPGWLTLRGLARAAFAVLWGGRKTGWNIAVALVAPARYLKRYYPAIAAFEQEICATRSDTSIRELHALHLRSFERLVEVDMPPIWGWLGAVGILGALSDAADPKTRDRLNQMGRGFEGERVIEMGLEMYAASRLLDVGEFDDLPSLADRIEGRDLPTPFLEAWDELLQRYAARGPNEMELASPRYGDDPLLLLRQLSFMARTPRDNDPTQAHERHVAERALAFAELDPQFGFFRRRLLRLAHRWTEAYAGERDTAKYHLVQTTYVLRQAALLRGQRLAADGRLDAAEDVFHLTWDELEQAERDATFDVRTPARERGHFLAKLDRQVREFPHLIDSRGRILRPPPLDEGNSLSGLGISPGVARGPIKVLENPYDKPVEPGDVLVAFTTDPGWTPLFINASAIILQIGGMMQHGGVVAREYGKPCVAGIEHVLTRFEDGQPVEVDGSAGVVRLL